MTRYRRRRRSSRAETSKFVLAGILIAAALMAGGFIAYLYLSSDRPPVLDRATYCPIDGPRSLTVMLLDTSDDLPAIAKSEVRKHLLDSAEAVPDYGLLEIRVLDPGSSGGHVVFSRCNPGDGSNLSEYRANPELARRRWREGFRAPLDSALTGALRPRGAQTSPLLSTLQAIAVERFTGRSELKKPKALLVVSDLLEHGADYSHYPGDFSYDRYKLSPAYPKYRTHLQGASITFLYVQRATRRAPNTVEHLRFWQEWVRDNKGQLKEAIRLQGMG